ncbi:uncharacterized protein LOC129985273 [Argiope bruennichi]|uniref:Kunitz-type U1-aranetoxin-Av1a like protein n=1 Tax=Argiope bruennichi TaxID=94029 RepID=A0A8T0EKS2_ARGBR|nr:uncharacterized protein LOC129985273 [Argiope bruennichi]KAF8774024.1 Kunitz-type U1-aranetoxin-Av1a like protein [Argiope bruennichi]
MAKMLCSLFLAGFVLQANAFSLFPHLPNPFPQFHIPNPFDYLPSVSDIASLLNPLRYLPNIANFLNPLNFIPNIVHLMNPFTYIPDILNPFHYIPNPLDFLPNPLDYIPNPFKYLPNPLDWIPGLGKDRCKLQPDVGPCKASVVRYYYDENIKACIKFQYGGCKGNRNNFKDKDECEKACRAH